MLPRHSFFVIFSILITHLLICYFYSPQIFYSDDISYSKQAYSVLENTFSFSSNFNSRRISLILPTALAYKFFGVNDYSSILMPLLCSLISIFTVYLITINHDLYSGVFASFLLATNVAQVSNANSLFPDIIVANFMLMIAYFIFSDCLEKTKSELFLAIKCIICFLFAFFAKATVIYLLPFLFFVFLFDYRLQKNKLFWKIIVFFSLIFLFSYYLLILNLNLDNELALPSDYWTVNTSNSIKYFLTRFSIDPIYFLLLKPFSFLASLACPVVLFPNKFFNQKNIKLKFWLIYFYSILICLWFGSISLDHYLPTPLVVRYWIYLLAPFALFAGIFLKKLFSDRLEFIELLPCVLCLLISYLINFDIALIIVLMFVLLIHMLTMLNLKLEYKKYLCFAILLVIFLSTILRLNSAKPSAHQIEKTIINKLELMQKPIFLYTDPRFSKTANYLLEYKNDSNLKFLDLNNIDLLSSINCNQVFLLINWGRLNYLANQYNELSILETKKMLSTWEILTEHYAGTGQLISLYKPNSKTEAKCQR